MLDLRFHALGRHHDHVAVDFVALQVADLAQAAGRQQQRPHEPGVGFGLAGIERRPQRADLVVRQDAIAGQILEREPVHAGHDGRAKGIVAGGVPVEGGAQDGQHLVGGALALVVGDRVEQLDQLEAAQGVDRPRADLRPHQAIEHGNHLARRAQALHAGFDVAVENVAHRPGGPCLLAPRHALGHRVLVLGNAAGMGEGCLASRLWRDADADGEPLPLSVVREPVAKCEPPGRQAPADEARQLVVGDDLARLQRIDGALRDRPLHGCSPVARSTVG